MVRGIFAGDAKDISVKAIGPVEQLFRMEQADGGILKSVLKSEINKRLSRNPKVTTVPFSENDNFDLVREARKEKWAVWSLEGGLQLLIETLKQHLINEGVEIYTGSETQQLVFGKEQRNIRLVGNDFEFDFQHSLLALPAYSAAKLFETSGDVHLQQLLSSIPYVDVAVVNVEYDGKLELCTGEAFGLLVPSCQKDIPILGIIFDSCSFPQHTLDNSEKSIFTVMMGGKWFDSLFGSNPKIEDIENMAVEHIKNILNIDQRPSRVLAKIHRKCIAQYNVGHKQRIGKIRHYIRGKDLPVSLIGSAYDGVGINDAILSARQHVECL